MNARMKSMSCWLLVVAAIGCGDSDGGGGTSGTSGASGSDAGSAAGVSGSQAGAGAAGSAGAEAGSGAGVGGSDVDSGAGAADGGKIDDVVCDGPYFVTIASDLDAFADCTVIESELRFQAVATADVASIELPKLRSLGTLTVSVNPGLVSLKLTALEEVGEVKVESNSMLTTLGMPALEHAGAITLYDNALVAALELPKLAKIDDTLSVDMNGALTKIALPALVSVDETDLNIQNDPKLQSIDLSALVSVGRDFFIAQNAALGDLKAPKLTTVGGGFMIRDNPELAMCRAQGIFDQLVDYQTGGKPPPTISGNDAAGTCD